MASKRRCYAVIDDSTSILYGVGGSAKSAYRHAREWADGDMRGLTAYPASSAVCRFIKAGGDPQSPRISISGPRGAEKVTLKRRK